MDLKVCNKTELLEICRLQGFGRLRESLTKDELISILSSGRVSETDFAGTMTTRKKLEIFIAQNWDLVNTNLPCKGKPDAGKCTVFECPEGRHVNCYLAAKRHL